MREPANHIVSFTFVFEVVFFSTSSVWTMNSQLFVKHRQDRKQKHSETESLKAKHREHCDELARPSQTNWCRDANKTKNDVKNLVCYFKLYLPVCTNTFHHPYCRVLHKTLTEREHTQMNNTKYYIVVHAEDARSNRQATKTTNSSLIFQMK